jgi:hypothetical protein
MAAHNFYLQSRGGPLDVLHNLVNKPFVRAFRHKQDHLYPHWGATVGGQIVAGHMHRQLTNTLHRAGDGVTGDKAHFFPEVDYGTVLTQSGMHQHVVPVELDGGKDHAFQQFT